MKKFLVLTAILEGLTGIALITIPNSIILILFGKPPDGPEGEITAMIAGTAILSLAIICWLSRNTTTLQIAIKGMSVYNVFIIAIALYGNFFHGIASPGLWLIIFLHSILLVWGAITLVKSVNNSKV